MAGWANNKSTFQGVLRDARLNASIVAHIEHQRATGNGQWALGNRQSEPKVDDPGNIDTTHHLSAKYKNQKKGGDGVEEAAAANSTPPPTVNLQLGGAVVHSVVLWHCSHGLPDF